MRMWKVPPKLLCDKHLLGEHVEMHMFVGSIRKGIDISTYIDTGLVEVDSIRVRHAELVDEMKRRGMNHKSPLPTFSLAKYRGSEVGFGYVSGERSLRELTKRCASCKERIAKWASTGKRGPNVARGHINIKCPFCGEADPSEHMGIRLEDGAWGCFRDPTHRGRYPVKLIYTLKGCSYAEAKQIWEEGAPVLGFSVEELEQKLSDVATDVEPPEPIQWPKEIRRFDGTRGIQGRFLRYLDTRGFPTAVAKRYGLRYALVGEHKHRLIFPLKLDGKLYGWTGRALGRSMVRYRTHPEGDGVRHLIWNQDKARRGGSILVICEGPFDALKVDYYGRKHGVRAIALLGVSVPLERVLLLKSLVPRFRRIVLLMDAEAVSQALKIEAALSAVIPNLERVDLPQGIHDPGAMSPVQAARFCKKLVLSA